jgi:beta-lactamase superfamily II metal-dependent hydrolase
MNKITFSKKEVKIKAILIVLLAIVLGVSCLFSSKIENFLGIGKTGESGNYVSTEVVESGKLKLHYIDVGQADATFIELPDGTTMLIDAATKSAGSTVVNYIKALGYSQITYFVLTHSDEDHVGGAPEVLSAFEVANIYRPMSVYGTFTKSDTSDTSDTSLSNFVCSDKDDLKTIYDKLRETRVPGTDSDTYADNIARISKEIYGKTIEAIYSEQYTIDGNTLDASVTLNYDGISIDSTDANNEFSINFYAPLVTDQKIEVSGDCSKTTGYVTKGYSTASSVSSESKNAISPAILIQYQSQKFLFTGDMIEKSEKDLLESCDTNSEKAQALSNVTVYQAAHHGSSGSNSKNFLNLIEPTYTVVSSNPSGNNYGHPHQEFLNRLASLDHDITDYLLRTDTQGTIVFGVSEDGKVVYTAGVVLNTTIFEVEWWQIAVGIFIVGAIVIISIKMTKNKNGTSGGSKGRTKTVQKTANKAIKTATKNISKSGFFGK